MLEKIDSPNCVECNTTEDTKHVLCHCVITEEARVRNWSGSVTLDMLRDEPELCRRILTPRFPDLKVKKEDTSINTSMYVLVLMEWGSFGPTVAPLYIAQRCVQPPSESKRDDNNDNDELRGRS